MAPRRPRKNDEAVESLIRNPSSKTDFRPIGNQQVITNLMFLTEKQTENAIRNNIKDPEDETVTCTQRPKERAETLEKDA